jgi:hypothetical protein
MPGKTLPAVPRIKGMQQYRVLQQLARSAEGATLASLASVTGHRSSASAALAALCRDRLATFDYDTTSTARAYRVYRITRDGTAALNGEVHAGAGADSQV